MKQYVVAPNGSDSAGTGSALNPLQTLASALHRAAPGDEILLRGGEYHEVVTVNRGGRADAPLTIRAYEDEQPTLLGNTQRPGLIDISAPYVVVDGLSFSSTKFFADKFAWIGVNPTAHHTILRNLTLMREGAIEKLYQQDWNDYGIVIEAADVTVDLCRLAGMGKGIHVKGKATGSTITNCHVGPTIYSCIVMGTSLSVVRGALIAANLLEGSYREDGIQFMPNLTLADSTADISNLGTIIYGNVIRDCNENAVDLKGAGQIVLDGNIVYRICGSNNGGPDWNRRSICAVMRGARASSRQVIERNNVIFNSASGSYLLDEWKHYNNVMLWNNFDFTGPDSIYSNALNPPFCGLKQNQGKVAGVGIKNNLLGLHKSADLALYLDGTSEVDADYNLYVGGRWIGKHIEGGHVQYERIEAWREALKQSHVVGADAHSRVVSTLDAVKFGRVDDLPRRDHTQYDFALSKASPGVGAGGPLTRTVGSGNGNVVTVADAGYFTDWFGRTDLPEEVVYIGQQSYKVKAVDYEANKLRLDRNVTWSEGQPVYWRTATPNIGLQPEQHVVSGGTDGTGGTGGGSTGGTDGTGGTGGTQTAEKVRLVLELTVNADLSATLRDILRQSQILVE